ncbi:heavy metal translocating P-type ATPase [Helicobacter trogontum]|uniref:Copper-transporting ATPase n=1 Tax=Helicobacter trogontum TaxID=50960 RepID=A0A4U8TEW7_9HELI|nr:heavy metal translocating P-type ATPase [Helicobacter trogontum]MCI5787098.1 heavy metal translocating P-type ATPase [Helicobacter trogontum]MDY5184696.1 heavy metal translocating P-type ATPase metal-binding domain-containing protein [Helicobacter trogontum]TLD97918.1 HAD family hydrolase [Helicobacter trogontum]
MQTPCTHCKQIYNKNALKEVKDTDTNETLYFCCNGCELAYSLLKSCDLESFYTKLGNNTLQTKQIQDSKNVITNFNSINFTQKYLKDSHGLKEVHFVIEGVVCAACVWLNEQILAKIHGIKEIKINYTTHKAKILFDPNETNFQNIYDEIAKIGYRAIVYDPQDKEQNDNVRNREYYIKLAVAIFCAMNVMWVNVGQYSGFFSGIDSISSNILNLASFILTTPVLFFCASNFYKQAYRGLKNGVIGMELLVVTGTSLVYCYSIYAWLSESGHTYFESVCMIILFVLSAKFLESLSQKRANDNLCRLNAILPLEARKENGEIISVYDVKVGDTLLVLAGEMLCVDGILLSPNAHLDYANISGESLTITKEVDEEVMAGAIALDKPLIYKAQKSFEDSSMSKLARLLKESEFSTPKIATTAFKIAGKFSRIVLSIALLSFCYYYFLAQSDFEYALLIAVSVIVIACPCALALATPIASVVGLNVGFKNHIIYTKADFLESLSKADSVVFDKTGTLTEGKMSIANITHYNGLRELILESRKHHIKCNETSQTNLKSDTLPINQDRAYLDDNLDFKKIHSKTLQSTQATHNLDSTINTPNFTKPTKNTKTLPQEEKAFLYALFKHNNHVIAKTIAHFLYNSDTAEQDSIKALSDKYSFNDFSLIAGNGFESYYKNTHIIGGSRAYMEKMGIILHDRDIEDEMSECFIAYKLHDERQYALAYKFSLKDSIKEGAKDLIALLRKHKKKVIILSGDRESVVKKIAQELHITDYKHSQTPLEKASFVQDLITNGHNVVMIGDGLNDSLALKYAQVGIAMGSGSEIALQYSDVIILNDSLKSLANSFSIAHKTLHIIKGNLIMSLVYNALAIPLAFFGFVIPLFAAAFMSLSSLCVVLNSLRLYKSRL